METTSLQKAWEAYFNLLHQTGWDTEVLYMSRFKTFLIMTRQWIPQDRPWKRHEVAEFQTRLSEIQEEAWCSMDGGRSVDSKHVCKKQRILTAGKHVSNHWLFPIIFHLMVWRCFPLNLGAETPGFIGSWRSCEGTPRGRKVQSGFNWRSYHWHPIHFFTRYIRTYIHNIYIYVYVYVIYIYTSVRALPFETSIFFQKWTLGDVVAQMLINTRVVEVLRVWISWRVLNW